MLLTIPLACLTVANMYDVVMPNYRPSCINGCLDWSTAAQSLPPIHNGTQLNQTDIDHFFSSGGRGASDAKNSCAMPGARSGMHEQDCGLHCTDTLDQFTYIYDSYAGPWCFCKDPVRHLQFLPHLPVLHWFPFPYDDHVPHLNHLHTHI
jgi:hypothetical protein